MKTFRLISSLQLLAFICSVCDVQGAPSRTSRKPKDAATAEAPKESPPEDPAAPAPPMDNSPPIKPVERPSKEDLSAAFFIEALTPYGTWHQIEGYGHCWKPKVDSTWRPYTLGHWIYSNHGWTWLSTENFGGIVYHYGRWLRLQPQGWFWVPDLEWAASWVSWRYGSQQVGWSPIPPEVAWNHTTGIGTWVDRDYKLGPDNYVFCEVADFGKKDLQKVLLPTSTNPNSVMHTVNTTNISGFKISSSEYTTFSGGPYYDWLAARSTDPIPSVKIKKEGSLVKFREQLQVASENSNSGPAVFKSILENQTLTVMAPRWEILVDPRRADALGFSLPETNENQKKIVWSEGETADRKPNQKNSGENSTSIRTPKLLKGWEYPSNDEEKRALQSKVAREVAGLSAQLNPARQFDPKKDSPSKFK